MSSMASKLTKEHLEQIAEYLTEKFPALKQQRRHSTASPRDIEIEIRERTIRVEEELKNQREIIRDLMIGMDKRFEQVDKRFEETRSDMNARFEQVDKRFEEIRSDMNARFEQVDKRFEDIDKRFTMMMWFTGMGLTIVTGFLTGAMVLIK